jgi:hypothetical protein
MSQAQNLPKQTRILIKDLIFQAKYQLSHTQMDLMAYLVNVPYWAIEIESDYYVLTSNKILLDLPHLHIKTLEATLKALKDGGFIQTKLVKVAIWTSANKMRAIKLTEKGREYNNKLILPSKNEEVIKLKKALKISEAEKAVLKKLLANMEVSKTDESVKTKEVMPNYTPNKNLIKFIEDTSKTFAKTGESICNFVPTWTKEAVFNINSYGKLSIKIDNNNEKQIKKASEINIFWLWLFVNQHRVGHCIDFNKKLDFKGLKERYLGLEIKIGEESYRLSNFLLRDEGIAIEVEKGEKRMELRSPQSKVTNYYTLEECERLVLGLC